MASVRFPGKILHPFRGLPMIEHVRRRALMADGLDRVVIATCDDDIADAISGFGGEVIRTGDHHLNGTTRIAEAISDIDCTHAVLLQGDEPLLLPRHVEALTASMVAHSEADAWNITGPINEPHELDQHSFVKCAVNPDNRVLYCFRRSPSMAAFDVQQSYIRKILGMFGFEKSFLLKLAGMPRSAVEQAESIEQMRIVESGHYMMSVPVDTSLPSVNEPGEADVVEDYLASNPEQQALLSRVLEVGMAPING